MTSAQPSWTRLEAAPNDPTMARGLTAEVHDPLWMLTRQLQFGELRGEDAGSPVWVGLEGAGGRLTRYLPGLPDGTTTGQPYDSGLPLERLVEAEPIGERPLWLAALAGLHFLRLLELEGAAELADAYRKEYPLTATPDLDPAAHRFASVLAGRALDGAALARAITNAGNALPPDPPVVGRAAEAALRAAIQFVAWYRALAGPSSPPAWRPERFEYQLAVAGPTASGEAVFSAQEYDQGRLDWSSFDLAAEGTHLGASGDSAGAMQLHSAGLPTPVTYRGMPAPRFWQFEDAAVDFGDLTAAPGELSKLLLIEFAIVYGNDHFLVPLDVEVGSFCHIDRLQVVDTFGVVTPVPHISEADAARAGIFRLFEMGTRGMRSSLFLLPPVIAHRLSGPPVEEIRLLHDEAANLAWAVEATVSATDGFPIDRASTWRAANSDHNSTPLSNEPAWRYTLRTPIPDHWFPLVPISDRPGSIHLELGSITPIDENPAAAPLGRILHELAQRAIPEEEITRVPTKVIRTWQYARWTDGSQHLWLGREREPVSPEGDSGLRFDVIEPTVVQRGQ